jgi:anti-sigma factor RsiW
MNHLTEEQIWDILDGNALPEVQKEHAQLLQTDAAYRAHFETYSSLHDQLCNLELDAPSMRFEQNLMERLQPSVKMQRSKSRLPLVFTVFMSVFAIIAVALIPNSNTPLAVPTPDILKQIDTEGALSWLSNPIFIYGFILFNLVLFFTVLDKKVFKPFFEKRMK